VGISEQEQEMFKKILVANRGEIAMRVIRACRELNIATAAIYSEADSTGIYVKKADEAYLVGPGPVKGFLDGQQIVELALRIGADAIHPGYGFLSENAEFAQRCQSAGITFIGPSPAAITLMGSKVRARELAESLGVPIVPGTKGGVSQAKGPCPLPTRSAIQLSSKRVPVAAAAGFASSGQAKTCAKTWKLLRVKRRQRSETAASFSKSTSSGRITLNFKSWPTGMATSFTSASGIVPFSAGIKSL
jgi:acetyl/propionyl-CoA carboxylase alpha subunit